VFRKTIVNQIKDPVIKTFWTQEYASFQQKYEQEATAAIQNKIGQFSSASVIRNMIGQPVTSFDFRKAMDEKKIIIMNLSKGRIGEDNMKLLGGMLITKIQLAAMSRVDILEEDRKDFYLYVDEFQNFANDSFADILSEARKFRLDLVIANQYIGQLVHDQNMKVKDAVFGNVGTFIAFRTGGEDVEFLEEKQFGPNIIAQDLLNLPNYNIYLRLLIDGVPSRPFSAITLPPVPSPEISYVDEIIEHTRKTYGMPKEEVEKMIALATGAGEMGTTISVVAEKKPEDKSQEMFDAVCTNCQKQMKVPFKPDPSRPVYCKDCFAKTKQPSAPLAGGQAMEKPEPPKKALLSRLKSRDEKLPQFAPKPVRKPARKTVDTEGLKKILLEEILPKK